ncbi:hypothetical protein DB346_23370 [Verrucomicrobia bacterium LW23]|nr:hypothetical protein DB346_23370 [Verrucomicrobia bacterium LW23]
MRYFIQLGSLLLLVALTSALSCWFSICYIARPSKEFTHSHEWIYKQLAITPEQEKSLLPIENKCYEQRKSCIDRIHKLNNDLATALVEDKGKSDRTDQIVEQINATTAQLQKVTLNHVFEMKEVLRPEQYNKLLRLTADGLRDVSQN